MEYWICNWTIICAFIFKSFNEFNYIMFSSFQCVIWIAFLCVWSLECSFCRWDHKVEMYLILRFIKLHSWACKLETRWSTYNLKSVCNVHVLICRVTAFKRHHKKQTNKYAAWSIQIKNSVYFSWIHRNIIFESTVMRFSCIKMSRFFFSQ